MEQRPALDDGFSSMSRREIRALRREFAKLDRLGARQSEPLRQVPEQVPATSVRGASTRPDGTPDADLPLGSPLSLGEALGRIRWSVVFLLLAGVLMAVATVLPGGSSRTDPVPAAPSPSTVPAAPFGPAGSTTSSDDRPSSRFGEPPPRDAATAPTFTFEGPFGP